MGKARRTPIILIAGGMFCVSLGMSVLPMSLGGFLSSASGEEAAMKINLSSKTTKTDTTSFHSGTKGLQAEGLEGEHSVDQLLLPPQALSMADEELVETTDASGGTMIHLQGRFQSRLQASHESVGSSVEKPLAPARPE
jgi:hypothetical protein